MYDKFLKFIYIFEYMIDINNIKKKILCNNILQYNKCRYGDNCTICTFFGRTEC